MPNVLIPTQRGEMPAYLAVPPSTGRVPGVVVLHDAGGMSQDHRNQADWLAEAGFLAVALDLYHRGGLLLCIRTIIRDLIARSGPTFDDVESARAWLLSSPAATDASASSASAWAADSLCCSSPATASPPPASTMAGSSPKTSMHFLTAACPVVGSYGAKDRWNQGVADQLERALERALVAHDVKEYPDAGHSFMNNHQSFFFKLLRFTGIAYDEPATLDARRRIAAFFHTHLMP